MKNLQFSFISCILYSVSSYRVERAIGGKELDLDEWPWLASIKVFEPSHYALNFIPIGSWHYCSATLISKQWVLTAAECVEKQGYVFYSRKTSQKCFSHTIKNIRIKSIF